MSKRITLAQRADYGLPVVRTYPNPQAYAEKNPLGGPARIFEAMAERVRAGEDFHAVLADFGLHSHQEVVAGMRDICRFTIRLQPIGKPRMTQRDKWKQRPVVMRYRQWADAARLQAPTTLPSEPLRFYIRAFFEMPKSWSKKLKAEQAGQPHRVKPDWDNIGKAVQDIFWQNDQMVAEGRVCKFWDGGKGARVEVEVF